MLIRPLRDGDDIVIETRAGTARDPDDAMQLTSQPIAEAVVRRMAG